MAHHHDHCCCDAIASEPCLADSADVDIQPTDPIESFPSGCFPRVGLSQPVRQDVNELQHWALTSCLWRPCCCCLEHSLCNQLWLVMLLTILFVCLSTNKWSTKTTRSHVGGFSQYNSWHSHGKYVSESYKVEKLQKWWFTWFSLWLGCCNWVFKSQDEGYAWGARIRELWRRLIKTAILLGRENSLDMKHV